MLGLEATDRLQLAEAVDRAIETAFGGQDGMLPPSSQTEALGILLSDTLPAVADAWGPILSKQGVTAKIFAAFTFSAPIAELRTRDGVTQRREAGDMLIIVDDMTSGPGDRRAVLIGASLAPEAFVELRDEQAGGDPWLEAGTVFRLTEMAASTPDRSLHDPTARGSAETSRAHAIIDLAAATVEIAGADAPSSLGRALVGMAAGEAGREAVGGGADDWSATVDDLLRATLRATSSGLAAANGALRTVTRHAGRCGTGFVVFDLRRPVMSEGAEAQPRGDGPLSVVHVIFSQQADGARST